MTKKWTVLGSVAKGSRPEAIFRGGPPASVEPGGRDDFTRFGFRDDAIGASLSLIWQGP